ncbi:flagellar type III secretion system pore protein FliP [Cupriavidus basilensis]|uniref:Flagellar biosynthetic protein FliP n=1 Tax=Cupriavidus basilensis TaxID=68895 RepID=A0ABT6AWS5_9BURK|nr:flagellar type III secretion system pore protein FliP [Cupriavidus basilensis]MDF3836818.1 flagellar type III secretion system pore protein FliP [Cupriavidus basilensis]
MRRTGVIRLLAGWMLALACLAALPALAATAGVDAKGTTSSALSSLPSRVLPGEAQGVSDAVRAIVLLTLLSLGPALVISMTAFIRIVIVLAMLRHAFGMPETPPTPVLVSLGLFMTAFVMMPAAEVINHDAVQPFLDRQIGVREFVDRSTPPLKTFMLKQVREDDVKLMYELSHKPVPEDKNDVGLFQLIPAFMLNELRVAFQIGFVILLPFLLIDLVISSVLLALGMLMVPPATIALPLKILMFVLIDGWSLVLRGLLGSFR